jgi:arginyl-tRNA synthetase
MGRPARTFKYSAVRARNIFRKLGRLRLMLCAPISPVLSDQQIDDFLGWRVRARALVARLLCRSAARGSSASPRPGLKPTHLAKYAFQLAKQFNLFYHHHHILSEPDQVRRLLLADGGRSGATKTGTRLSLFWELKHRI